MTFDSFVNLVESSTYTSKERIIEIFFLKEKNKDLYHTQNFFKKKTKKMKQIEKKRREKYKKN